MVDRSELPNLGRQLAGYPDVWPAVAAVVKATSGWRCEHCGAYLPPALGAGVDRLTVHHLDGRVDNLMTWNLVPLCWPCHSRVARRVGLDLELRHPELFDDGRWDWLPARRRERRRYPWRPVATPASCARERSIRTTSATGGTGGAGGRAASERVCACGCGRPVPSGRRDRLYATRACQQRVHRERHAAQGSLLPLLVESDQ